MRRLDEHLTLEHALLTHALAAWQLDRLMSTLVAFYRKVRPAGPGWAAIRVEAGRESDPRDHMGLATLGWVAGCAMIWSSLFAIGNFLYGRAGLAWGLTAIFAVSSAAVIYVMNHLWANSREN